MPDYQKMYHSLFNDVTDAISKLQQAQQKTEEMYMDSKETVLTPFKRVRNWTKSPLPQRKSHRPMRNGNGEK